MPVFISYSHEDKEFAHDLAMQLVTHGIGVWIDEWELAVGDSLVDKIESAIENSSALIIILSKTSTESIWCKKELSVSLIKELEKRQVFVLPVVLEDCNIPLFLRDKIYADFRKSKDVGLEKLLVSLARITTTSQGRIEESEGFVDFAIDWGVKEGFGYTIRLTIVEFHSTQNYSCITEVDITPKPPWFEFFEDSSREQLSDKANHELLKLLASLMDKINPFTILLEDSLPKYKELTINDKYHDCTLSVLINSRWLGQHTGGNVILNIGNQIKQMFQTVDDILKRPQ